MSTFCIDVQVIDIKGLTYEQQSIVITQDRQTLRGRQLFHTYSRIDFDEPLMRHLFDFDEVDDSKDRGIKCVIQEKDTISFPRCLTLP